jgi:hypothetical protein
MDQHPEVDNPSPDDAFNKLAEIAGRSDQTESLIHTLLDCLLPFKLKAGTTLAEKLALLKAAIEEADSRETVLENIKTALAVLEGKWRPKGGRDA